MAARIIQELASIGCSNVSDLAAAVQNSIQAEDEEMDLDDTKSAIMQSMRSLAEHDFFARIRPAQLQIPHDAREDAGEQLTRNPPENEAKLKGKKALEQHWRFVDEEMEKRTDAYLFPDAIQTTFDVADEASVADADDLYICVNYAKTVKSTRNTILSQYAITSFGESHGKVAAAVVKQIDFTTPVMSATNEADQNQPLNMSRLSADVSRASETVNGNGPYTNGWHHDEEMTNGIAETNGHVADEDIHQSLRSLMEGRFSFLREEHEGRWTADKMALRKFLVRQEIMKIARQRAGIIGVRLMRILIDKGRLDERLLQEIGLLNAKEMRQSLEFLHLWGFIEVQEVPKDPQRQPNRTIFLWFYDQDRVERKLLDEIYKSIARLYERIQYERKKMRPTLEKVEKEDCEGQEESVMSVAEVTLLQQYRRKETWLLGEIMRLDESVALLRDL